MTQRLFALAWAASLLLACLVHCALPAWAVPPAPDEIRKTVLRLADPDYTVRESAYEKLYAWGREAPERVLDVLSAVSSREGTDPEVLAKCRGLTERILWVKWRKDALKLVPEGDKELQEIVNGLFDKPSDESLKRFVQRDPLDPSLVTAALEHFLRHPDRSVRRMATCAVGCRGTWTDGVAEAFFDLLRDEDLENDTREAVAVSLARRSEVDVSKIAEILAAPDVDYSVAACCVAGLMERPDDKVRDLFLASLDRPGPRLKCLILGRIHEFRDAKVSERVRRIAGDEKERSGVRRNAILAWARVEGKRSAPEIAGFLEKGVDPPLRAGAAEALEMLFGQQWERHGRWGEIDVEQARAWWAMKNNKDDPDLLKEAADGR